MGLDLGIKDFISNGEKLKNEVKVNEKRLKGLQKGLVRCKPESKNRYKLKLKTQRLYLKIRNARKHMIYKLANKIYERKYNINKNEIDKNNRLAIIRSWSVLEALGFCETEKVLP